MMGVHIAIAIIFTVIGAIIGLFIGSTCAVAGRADEQSEKAVEDESDR